MDVKPGEVVTSESLVRGSLKDYYGQENPNPRYSVIEITHTVKIPIPAAWYEPVRLRCLTESEIISC